MGRRCAWCATGLHAHGGAWSPASEAICRGCFEELEMAQAQTGVRFGSNTGKADREPQVTPAPGRRLLRAEA